jgi:hypothetical protein
MPNPAPEKFWAAGLYQFGHFDAAASRPKQLPTDRVRSFDGLFGVGSHCGNRLRRCVA